MIRLSHQSDLDHQENIISNIRNFVVESEIRSLIINTRNIVLVRESTRKHIYWLSSIHRTLQYLRWIQYQLFRISHRRLRHQKFKHYIRNLRSNSNHLSASRIFQNSIHFVSKSIVLFYSFDEFDISLEVRFWIIISMKFLLITSTLKSFYLLESQFENISIDDRKSIFVSCYSDNINIRVRKSVNSLNRIFNIDNLISIFESFLIFERFQKLYLFVKQINLTSSTSMMKLITSRIQISNQFFKLLISSFNILTRIQYWNHSFSSRTLRNHIYLICKRFCFFCFKVELNIISLETTRIF